VNNLQNRVKKLREAFQQSGIDSMVIMKPENRRYISGFTGSAGIAFITASEAYLLTDFRYVEQAEQEAEGYVVIQHGDKIMDSLKEVVSGLDCAKIGFEKDFITYANFETIKNALSGYSMIPTENLIESLRSMKDANEIHLIRKAVAIADAAFAHMCSTIQPGSTEKEVAVELEYFMRKSGSQKNSFPPIVASGPRASLPHAQPTDREIQKGDMVKMDFGASYEGYCSDLTRTVFVGEITKKQRMIFQTVLNAQLLAIDSVAPGKSGVEIDNIARKYIADQGFGEYFGHGLGHGVGLYIHESPRLSQSSTDTLAEGNIVTVEPGIYIPEWGGVRIEDMLVVTQDGYENLTKASKEIYII
jgi:Xaa-Pro aminopeptidase